MKHLVEKTRTVIYLVMCVLFTIQVYIYFDYIFGQSSKYWIIGGLIITVVVIVDYFSRRYVTNIFVFFLVHLVLVGLTLLIPPSITEKVILTIISVSFLFLAVGFWKKDVNERSMYVIDVPLGLLLFFVLIYMHASISKRVADSVAVYAYLAGILYLILFYVREYLNKVLAYTMSSGNFTREMDRIFSTNISLIMIFNLIMVFAIILANTFFSNSAFNFIGRFLRWIARLVFGRLEGVDTQEKPQETMGQEETYFVSSRPVQEETKSFSTVGSKGFNMGETIFEVILLIVFIIAAGFALYGIYRFFRSYMNRHNQTMDIIEKVEAGEKKEKAEGVHRKREWNLFGTNNDKIRKIYREKIKGFMRDNERAVVRESFTPQEIQGMVVKYHSGCRENMETLTQLYRRARYSDQELTKSEVEMAKKAKL